MVKKCHICSNYNHIHEECSNCKFEYDDNLPWTNDDSWDIFKINDDEEWSHLQIMYRLKKFDIDVLQVYNWVPDDNSIVLVGVRAYPERVARALGVDMESIVSDLDAGIMVINLFKERYLRGLI